MILDEIRFRAEIIEGYEEEYSTDVVYGMYFGEGDPEQGGHHWNIMRSLRDDEICAVKEIQQLTVYGGIVQCELTHHHFICEFNNVVAQEIGTHRLHIDFEIDIQTWETLKTQAGHIFDGKSYFTVLP